MDILQYNRDAWDRQVKDGNEWTLPVSPEKLALASRGEWSVVLTPTVPVPRDWFGEIKGRRILALASAGGQQAPIFAAAGAAVVVLDNSPSQLAQDRLVAERESLTLELAEGDMRDLSRFSDESFDLVFHPCSNCFVPEIQSVWREAYRVLKRGGVLLSGMVNPVAFLTDPALESQGIVQFKYKMPYSDLTSLTEEERRRYSDKGEPLAFGHSLEQQIGGQLQAGFKLTAFYEDGWTKEKGLIHEYLKCYFATRAVKE